MRAALLLLAATVAALLDLTVGSGIALLGGHPSFCVALVAPWAVLRRRDEAMLLIPACGLVLGLLGHEPLGASALALTALLPLASVHDQSTTEGRLPAAVAVTAAGAAAYVAVLALVEGIAQGGVPSVAVTAKAMAGAGLLTLGPALALYPLLARSVWQPRVRGQFRRY